MSQSKVRVRVSGVPDGLSVNTTVHVYPYTKDEFAQVVAAVGVARFMDCGPFAAASVDGGSLHLHPPGGKVGPAAHRFIGDFVSRVKESQR